MRLDLRAFDVYSPTQSTGHFMETQRMPPQSTYGETEQTRQPLRVNPNYPLPSSLPQAQSMEHTTNGVNGVGRTTSRRRRSSGSGPGPLRSPISDYAQPRAPEVPKAPPVSYRFPPSTGNHEATFAERAAALTGKSVPLRGTDSIQEPASQPVKPVRRGSLNRPIGGLYSEIQQHKRDSYPPPNGPVSPRRFSNPPSSQQYQGPDPLTSIRGASSATTQQPEETLSPTTQPDTRHTSIGGAKPQRKEWAADRSPLQKLEVKLSDISKEEKRARMQEAEQRLRETKGYAVRRKSGQERGTAVNRTKSGQVSTDPAAIKPGLVSGQVQDPQRDTQIHQPEANIQDIPSEPRPREGKNLPRSDARRASLPNEIIAQRTSQRIPPGSKIPIARDRSRRISAKSTEQSRIEQQPERGVRFQGEEDIEDPTTFPPKMNQVDSRNRRRSTGTDALARSDEAHSARRDRLRQDPTTMVSQSTSKEVPIEQQNLYQERVETSHDNASAATYGGAPDPVPRQAVRGQSQASKYEIPPQTASGIQARQVVGFGSGSHSAVEVPAHRKHHLSDILHRGHNHATDTLEQSGAQPRQLDEWRRAGTARLTAADFGLLTDTEKDQVTWWEGESGSGRKARRSSNAIAKEGGYRDDVGKFLLPFTTQANQPRSSQGVSLTAHAAHTRPYLKHGEDTEQERLPILPVESHMYHFWHRPKHDQASRLASAYSYSCPDLAVHDPSHTEHFCEPYLSKELTQSMRSIRIRPAPALDTFNPPLYLKCGPLLRYTGMKRDRLQSQTRSGGTSSSERETWRGSVMIVTADADSWYNPAPMLRLFSEPMDLVPPPMPHRIDPDDTHDLPSEIIDPVAGLPKLSRSGKTIYVKPVDDLDHEKDLSRIEDDDGLFEETRTAAVPTSYGTPDFKPSRSMSTSSGNPKAGRREGRTQKKGQFVTGVRLHAERGVTFWRFNLEIELGAQQTRVAYSINSCPAIGFWVPARGHSMNVMFHSCNGFSMSVNPDHFSGPDPLWRDVLNSHQSRPFHVMIGGGDQIYNDAVMSQSPIFREWLEIKNPHTKHTSDFTPSLREELETFYLERYSMWFSQGLFGMANSQIPMVNMWDDHDIIDGFGSYPHQFMSTPVFCGLGAVAFKYYMLFQHQSVPDEGPADEPSWLMGAARGPYINELSRSIFVSLGKNVALLALDCRTERMREEILSEASYEVIFDRCRREIIEGETKHLIVLLGVPIAYPRLVWLENLLTSKVMDPVKALGRAGMLGGFLNKFDGGVEILDDLDDHWTAKNHKQERNWFIQELQELASEKSVRVTILGGDVHLAAVGQFYSNPKLRIPKDKDHRYMVNVVSSAIVNTPPPNNMADILNRRNKTHHLDSDTDENMIPMFTHDVNGNTRNNKRLLPRRNWCSIREYKPGSTPPPTPPPSEPETPSDESPPPRTPLQRTLSLTRGDLKPGNLIRRLSGRGPPPDNGYPPSQRYHDRDTQSPDSTQNDGYFPSQSQLPKRASTISGNTNQRNSSAPLPNSSAPLPRPGNFHRRPTNLSEKAVTKGDMTEDLEGHINLEHGLDVVINCEINQKNPAGHTVPYRLLVPALFYEGNGDQNTEPYRKKSIFSKIGSIRGRRRNTMTSGQGQGDWSQREESLTPDDSENEDEDEEGKPRPRRWSFGISQRRQYRDQTPPLEREHGLEREIGEQGTQQQRQHEHRSQQIGQKPFAMPPNQQRQYGDLGQQQQLPQTPDQERVKLGEVDRQDSVDYHSHLESSPSGGIGTGNGYPGRKPSKVDRMLGVGGVQRSNSLGTAKLGEGQRNSADSYGAVQRQAGAGANEYGDRESSDVFLSEDGDELGARQEKEGGGRENRLSQGYGGIEAYSEKNNKGWRRFFGSKAIDKFG